MATYIMLINLTQEGIRKIKDSADRLEANKKACRDLGAEVKEFFMVMGRYDAVFILEAPDDETVAKIALTMGSKGAIRTETLRAFTEKEYRKIMSAL